VRLLSGSRPSLVLGLSIDHKCFRKLNNDLHGPVIPMTRSLAWQGMRGALFGDIAVVCFVIVQCLDGVLTYLGVHIWGPSIEANPLVSSAVALAGLGGGLAAAKLAAIGLGMALHLRRVHGVVAFLTAFYIVVAIVPWTLLFLSL
jgi:hypothetical protein